MFPLSMSEDLLSKIKHLRHGDIVALMCDGPPGWQGFLSSPNVLEGIAQDEMSGLRVCYEPVAAGKDKLNVRRPDFLSTCLWRIDASRGEGAPGKMATH